MNRLSVESIISIYGKNVRQVKVYRNAKCVKSEDFLQTEPAAFSLSDEPDALRIYIDKESAAASLDGTLERNTVEFEVGKSYFSRCICGCGCIFNIKVVKRTEKSVTYIYAGRQCSSMIKMDDGVEYIEADRYSMAPAFRADHKAEEQAANVTEAIADGKNLAEYYNLVRQLAADVPGYKPMDTRELKKLLGEQLPGWDEEEWEELRIAVAAERQRIWDKQEKTVTMTRGQWNKLTCYLITSTRYREREADAWAKLAVEKETDGRPKYKNAAGNAEYWQEMITSIEEIRRKIDKD